MARPKKSMQSVPSFALSSQERELLGQLISPVELTTEVRRAHALLWLDAGHSPQTVAKRLHVSRQTVYNWITGFQRRSTHIDIQARLADKPRSGRPRTLPRAIDPLLAALVQRTPVEVGYRASVWNASLLRRYLSEVHHITVNRVSVNVALRRLGIRLRVLVLTPDERDQFTRLMAHAALTKEGKRAQALLWLDEGASVRKVAVRIRTSRQTIYNWITEFQAQRGESRLQADLHHETLKNLSHPLPAGNALLPVGTIEHHV